MPIPGANVTLTQVELDKLTAYVSQELQDSKNENGTLQDDLKRFQKAYDGRPPVDNKTFPWPGASNLEIPIIAMHTDSVVARIFNTLFSVDPFWSIRPLRPEMQPFTTPAEDYLDWSRKSEYNLYKSLRTATLELVKFGWCWLKPIWETYSSYTIDRNGEVQQIIVNRPNVYHVLLQDVLTQAGVEDTDQSEWKAHRIRLTDETMRLRASDLIYQSTQDVEDVIKSKESIEEVHESLNDKNTPRSRERLNTLYELYLNWKIDPQAPPVPIIATFHEPTKKFLRLVYNQLGFTPLLKAKFLEREGRQRGYGLAERLWMMQREMSTLHNQQVDNSTLANTRFFLGKRNVVKPGTTVSPGYVMLVNDTGSDLKPVQMGDIYQSQGRLEQMTMSYAERLSGVSDYQLGRESDVAKTGATATGTMALIQEGNRRFDLNVRDFREVLGEVGKRILELNQRFRPEGSAYFVQGAEGAYTEQLLMLPEQFSAAKIAVEVTASTATINREVQKQSLMALMGVQGQYFAQMQQFAMSMANPQIPGQIREVFARQAMATKALMDQIMQTFDIKAVDDLAPGLFDGQNPNQVNGTAGTPGANGAFAGAVQQPGMAGMVGEAGQPDSNSSNGTGELQ